MKIEQAAYIVGIFMGAKLACASRERLNALKEYLVL